MKNLLSLLAILLIQVSLSSQTIADVKLVENNYELELRSRFKFWKIYQMDSRALKRSIMKPEGARVQFNFPGMVELSTLIQPDEIRSDNYVCRTQTENGVVSIPRGEVITFSGKVLGAGGERIALTVNENFIYGVFQQNGKNWYIEPLYNFIRTAPAETYIVYEANDGIDDPNVHCGVDETYQVGDNSDNHPEISSRSSSAACRQVEMAIAIDFSMFNEPATPTVSAAINTTLGILNNVRTNYYLNGTNNFNDDVKYLVSEHFIVTCSTCNPWTNTTINDQLNDFDGWGARPGNFTNPHDLATMWTDLWNSGTIGLAWVGSVCFGGFKYNVCSHFDSGNANTHRVLQAHEIGHNFDAVQPDGHDASGSGFIMAPSVNNTTTWSAASKTDINAYLASSNANCLAVNCGTTAACDSVSGVTVTQISVGGIRMNWNTTTTDSYRVRIRVRGTTTTNPGAWLLTETTTINSNYVFPFSPVVGTDYDIQIQNVCGANFGTPTTIQLELTTVTIPTATGIYVADYELTTSDNWTHYFDDNGTAANFNDDLLLFSLAKANGAVIPTNGVTVGCTNGSGTAVNCTSAPYVIPGNPWWVACRWWNIVPTTQPSGSVNCRYYYRTEDLTGINTAMTSVGRPTLAHADLHYFKFNNTTNPNPTATTPPHNTATAANFVSLTETYSAFGNVHRGQFGVTSFSGGGIGGISLGPLPVTLKDFTGVRTEDGNKLQWNTEAERGVKEFSVERSLDGTKFSEWKTISARNFESGAGYTLIDQSPLGELTYYRLSHRDLDEKVLRLGTVSVRSNVKPFDWSLFPNPVPNEGGKVRISVSDMSENGIDVEVTDVLGRIMNRSTFEAGILNLELPKLDPGYYQVQLKSQNLVLGTKKLIVQ
jgi:hypothetical protein